MKYKVGIICAIDRETRPVLSHLQDQVVSEKAMLEVYEGKIEGVDAAVLSCGCLLYTSSRHVSSVLYRQVLPYWGSEPF